MQFNELLHHTSEWLKGTGPHSDIVISSRIRLARNLDKFPFPHWASKKQSEDVLSSVEEAIKKTDDLKTFYPTQVLSTARDIINLWVSRMIFSGLELVNKVPFSDVIIHGTILTKEGQRMSKSLGTGIDPMSLIEKYGADATRFGLIWQTMGNQDIHWSEEHVVAGKKFCNKIWNASRFVVQQIGISNLQFLISKKISNPKPKTAADKKILSELKKITKEVETQIEKYEFGQALHKLYSFFWHEFCDDYIEKSKSQMSDTKTAANTRSILFYVLNNSLKLLHPFLPFITEEIWQIMYPKKPPLLVTDWPKP